MQGIRLSSHDINAIKKCFTKCFLENDSIWIFGSRADLNKKGGDIDLYIETNFNESKKVFESKTRFSIELQDLIGEQKIDIVVNMLKSEFTLPIYKVAKEEGIKII